MRKPIELNNSMITKEILSEIYFMSFAEGGAMGEPGAVFFYDKYGKLYHFNYVFGDVDLDKVEEVFPVLKECKFGMFGIHSYVAKGWHYINLGAGNHLIVKNKVYNLFTELITECKKPVDIYQQWMDKAAYVIENITIVPNPSKDEVNKYINRWDSLENYVLQEKALDKLFFEVYPNNTDISEVLIKASSLNDFYSTNIFSIFSVAKHICELNIDERLKKGDPTLINEIANVSIRDGVNKNFYSFASKYCSHHNPQYFPIYDSYVEKCLIYFKRKDKFSEFKKKDLKDYSRFKDILIKFKKFYCIDEYSLKDIDRYLWQLGKIYFPNNY